jgi:Ca-activated chloride channel homolog
VSAVRQAKTLFLGAVAVLLALLMVMAVPLTGSPASATPVPTDGKRQGSLLLVLDASGSMKEPAGGGRTRFQAATSAMREVLGALPGDLDVGLRVYGSKISDGPGSCQDSELVVPVTPLNRKAIRAALSEARPLGNTPLAHSLQQAAQDLPEEGQRTIVLISDGEESCGGDPCQVARDLSRQGVDVRIDVIGFQVGGKARDELTCIAQAGRGTFYDAPDASALTAQLQRLSARAARAYVPAGIPVEGTPTADGAPTLEPEQYLDTIGDDGEVETYLVSPDDGASVHVAATLRPTTLSAAESEVVEVSVAASDGAECQVFRATGQGAFDKLTPITAGGTLDGEDLDSCGPPPYAVQVTRVAGTGVRPLEVVYIAEPAVADAAGLPAAVAGGDYDVAAQVGGKAVPAVGAPSFTGAPVLAPGRYTDSILVGETLFYGVELDWGQQLVCDARFGGSTPVDQALGFHTPTAAVRTYGPTRTELKDLAFSSVASGFYEADEPVDVHVATPPVRYLNRNGGLHAIHAALPGTYYCGVLMNGDSQYASAGEIPVQLTVDVVGAAGEGAPEYDEGEAAEEPGTDASDGPNGQPRSDEETQDAAAGGGLPWWFWALLVVIVIAAGVAVALRRRRSAGSPSAT